jgi:hypothetical protein
MWNAARSHACCDVAVHIIKIVHRGGVYDKAFVQKRMERSEEVEESGGKLSAKLKPSGQDDMSILAMQRLNNQYVTCSISSSFGSSPTRGKSPIINQIYYCNKSVLV